MNNPAESGNISLLGSILLGIISWFTPENIDLGIKILTGAGALTAAVFAARYHFYATKEKKESLKKLRNGGDK